MAVAALLLLAVVVGCKSESTEKPPVTDDTVLRFHIEESVSRQTKTVELEVALRRSPDGWAANIKEQSGAHARVVHLDESLLVKRRRLTLKAQFPDVRYQPGPLWIPRSDLVKGDMTVGGVVGPVQEWEGRRVHVLTGKVGNTTGTRYYDAKNGMLYGFKVKLALLTAVGKRVDGG